MEEINNFIKTIMEKDLEEGKVSQIVTHFRHALKRESPKREKTQSISDDCLILIESLLSPQTIKGEYYVQRIS